MSRGKKKQKWGKWERFGKNNRHHILPKKRGGLAIPSNLLILDINRHNAWHFLFGNFTIHEVVVLLQRLERAKQGVRV